MSRIIIPKSVPPAEINKFLGLNENQDAEFGLKLGEATKQVGWRVTSGLQLKRMEGHKTLFDFGLGEVNGMAHYKNKLIIAHGTHLYEFEEGEI